MSKEQMEIGAISKPRFEFRSFGQNFDEAAKRMARLSVPVPEKVGKEAATKSTSYLEPMISTIPKLEMVKWILKPMYKP